MLSDVGVGRRPSPAVVVTNALRVAVECYLLVDVSPAAFLSLVDWSPFVSMLSWCPSSSSLPCVKVASTVYCILSVYL